MELILALTDDEAAAVQQAIADGRDVCYLVVGGERLEVPDHPDWCSGNIHWQECECWDSEQTGPVKRTLVPPKRWTDLTGPCETCRGAGRSDHPLVKGEGVWAACPDCIDGRKLIALRKACERRVFNGGAGGTAPVTETLAHATVEVLPVVLSGYYDTGIRPAFMTENCADPRNWISDGSTVRFITPITPRPVPGEDYVVVLKLV